MPAQQAVTATHLWRNQPWCEYGFIQRMWGCRHVCLPAHWACQPANACQQRKPLHPVDGWPSSHPEPPQNAHQQKQRKFTTHIRACAHASNAPVAAPNIQTCDTARHQHPYKTCAKQASHCRSRSACWCGALRNRRGSHSCTECY